MTADAIRELIEAVERLMDLVIALDLPSPEAKYGCTRRFSHEELVAIYAALAALVSEQEDRT